MRTLLILGAGASIEFGVPSTAKMNTLIKQHIDGREWIKHQGGLDAYIKIQDTLGEYLSSPEAVNFEKIYHCIHELAQFEPITPYAVDEYRFLLKPFFSKNHTFNREAFDAAGKGVIEAIYQSVSAACESPALSLDTFSEFLTRLKQDGVLRVYSTNYDDLALQADPTLYTGFGSGNGIKFDADDFWNSDWNKNSVFQMHGSVHFGFPRKKNFSIGELGWFDDRSEALKHSIFTGSDDRRMDGSSVYRSSVITGLDKLSRIQVTPFSHYYSAISRDAMEADRIVVVGSGLTDLHINVWVCEARKLGVPIVVVDCSSEGIEIFNNSRKQIEMFHTFGIDIFNRGNYKRDGSWVKSLTSKAYVWDGGFQKFLSSPEEFQTILHEIET